ncbi:thioesterase family protein [Roseivirga echinicomitans]
MVNSVEIGSVRVHRYKVKATDSASFEAGEVHQVMSTFALAREMEWASRLFALELKEEGEEGIGTMLEIAHVSPALFNTELSFEAKLVSIQKNELICEIRVSDENRLVATGRTGQKILKKDKLNQIFTSLDS